MRANLQTESAFGKRFFSIAFIVNSDSRDGGNRDIITVTAFVTPAVPTSVTPAVF